MDVTAWLEGLGLGQHAGSFAANRVTAEVLPSLTDEDLKALGVAALGDRRRLLSAIGALGKTTEGATNRKDGLAAQIEQWPSILALPLREYEEETHPVLKLWHACDVVELLLRFMVMVGVAEAADGGELPEETARELWDRIEQPTLGKWRGMAEALAKVQTPQPPVVPEWRGYLREVLVPLLDGAARPRTVESSFSQLRNHLAHGAGVTRAAASRLMGLWQPRVEDALGKASWLNDVSLVVTDGSGGAGQLRGPTTTPSPLALPPAQPLPTTTGQRDAISLVREDRVLMLWPLALYGEPRSADREPMAIGESPQVYTRRGEVQLEYTPLGSDGACQAVGEETALEAFKRVFRLETRRAEATALGYSVRGFEQEVRRDSERLIGRHEEIETLVRIIRETEQGVIWISGRPGGGKSYLVSRVASVLLDEEQEGRHVLPYRFKVGDDRCSRDAFLQFAIERLEALSGERNRETAEEERQREKGRPLDRLTDLLASGKRGRGIVFVLDGLDEVAERDPDFAKEVPLVLRGRGVLWVCAGRSERGLPEAFGRAGAIEPFAGGLPRMSEGDIRTMLLEKIGPLRKRLLRGDREARDRVVNPFVERVAKNAEGLPIYVKYVVGDVLSGKVSPESPNQLPPSLAKYHEELLRRCSVGDLQQVMTPLAATLAVAKEPLTAEELAALLVRRNLLRGGEEAVEKVRQALSAIGTMVSLAPDPDGGEGYTLWHHSLREHMLTSPQTTEAVATARTALSSAAAAALLESSSYELAWHRALGSGRTVKDLLEASELRAVADWRYLIRQGVAHLVDEGRTAEAIDLLTSPDHFHLRPIGYVEDTIRLGRPTESLRTRYRESLISQCKVIAGASPDGSDRRRLLGGLTELIWEAERTIGTFWLMQPAAAGIQVLVDSIDLQVGASEQTEAAAEACRAVATIGVLGASLEPEERHRWSHKALLLLDRIGRVGSPGVNHFRRVAEVCENAARHNCPGHLGDGAAVDWTTKALEARSHCLAAAPQDSAVFAECADSVRALIAAHRGPGADARVAHWSDYLLARLAAFASCALAVHARVSRSTAAASGSVELASFPTVVTQALRCGATGSLRVTMDGEARGVYFRDGNILFCSSTNPQESLSAILRKSESVRADQLDVLEAQVCPGRPLFAVLAESGLVNRDLLKRTAQEKIVAILGEVLSTARGTYEFAMDVLPQAAPPPTGPTDQVLLAAVRRVPESAFAARLVTRDVVLTPAADPAPLVSTVPEDVWVLLDSLDGRKTLGQACAVSGVGEQDGTRTACALLLLGAIRKDDAAPSIRVGDSASLSPLAEAYEAMAAFLESVRKPGGRYLRRRAVWIRETIRAGHPGLYGNLRRLAEEYLRMADEVDASKLERLIVSCEHLAAAGETPALGASPVRDSLEHAVWACETAAAIEKRRPGGAAAARTWFRRAVTAQRRVVAEAPRIWLEQVQLLWGLHHGAMAEVDAALERDSRDAEAARALAHEVVDLAESLVAEEPERDPELCLVPQARSMQLLATLDTREGSGVWLRRAAGAWHRLAARHSSGRYACREAQALARTGSQEETFTALGFAVELGYDNAEEALGEPDFGAIREHPRFRQLVEEMRRRRQP
jgi:hypothetical protein